MLNKDELKQLILTEFDNIGWNTSLSPWAEGLAQAVAYAVVDHIKSKAITTSAGDPSHTHEVK